MLKNALAAFLIVLACCGASLAEHPLITDDTGTQGTGKLQVETDFQVSHQDSNGVTQNTSQPQVLLTYGVIDPADLVLTIPYLFVTTKVAGSKNSENGPGDITFEMKWRFYEKDDLSFALKPGVILPAGDAGKGLGAGRLGGSLFFISTWQEEPWAFHFNAGYTRNENRVDERTDIWHVSLASSLAVCSWMKVVANVGVERDTVKGSQTPAAFILGGLVFPVAKNLALDAGVRGGLTDAEPAYSLLAGATIHF